MMQSFKKSPIIVVLDLNNPKQAPFIAEAILNGGLINLEITLRNKYSLECLMAIKKEFPSVNVGAGTIIHTNQLQQIKDSGASFAVSPGHTKKLVVKAKEVNIPYLPGASTPSEIINLLELGVTYQKFFHASNMGGYKVLKMYANLFPEVQFCPTGGISQDDFTSYVNLENVFSVGGSWMVPPKDIEDKNYKNIELISKETVSIYNKLNHPQ